ncbi:MAG: SLC13 family permease [Thermoplasmata archaeon]|nr:SLC13 family permease [Thermoplasmata archaeon]
MNTEYLIIGIFIVTYVFISVRRVSKIRIERPAIALFGGIAMVFAGAISTQEAMSAIDLNTIALLLGMMLIVSALEISGFFNWAAVRVTRFANTQVQLLSFIVVLTALLSALFLNDAVVLMLTPIVLKVAKTLNVNPVPYLVGEAMASNIGSVATPIGNPQNAYIAMSSGIPFIRFVIYLLPITLLCILIEILVLRLVFRKELSKPIMRVKPVEIEKITGMHVEKAFHMISVVKLMHASEIKNRRLLVFSLVVFGCVFAGFLASSTAFPISIIAIAGGAMVFALVQPLCGVPSRDVLKGVDWGILIFFAGLFILLRAVKSTVLMGSIEGYFTQNPSLFNLSFVTVVLSNLISNVPAVMLLAPASNVMAAEPFYFTLAAISTLAGNATLLGAAANIIVAESALSHGFELKFKQFLIAGLPTTVLTVIATTIYLAIIF